ncbi:MAG: hypothetical protein WCA13_11630 [Terriglobales bacterium]
MFTANPDDLLRAIEKAIANGDITTWQETSQGSFTHTPASGQWKNQAWFRPSIDEKGIVFNIIRPKGSKVSKEAYAVYHGRFSEMLLAHFDADLSAIRLTALAAEGDLV